MEMTGWTWKVEGCAQGISLWEEGGWLTYYALDVPDDKENHPELQDLPPNALANPN
jgi:hypothetical protein